MQSRSAAFAFAMDRGSPISNHPGVELKPKPPASQYQDHLLSSPRAQVTVNTDNRTAPLSQDIDYDHRKNLHTINGAAATLPYLFADSKPTSLLDVGCGTGTWVKASINYGIQDVFGIDGVTVEPARLLFSRELFRQQDLTQAWNLGRRFDVVLCLEVGEHLAADAAATLVRSLTAHSDFVVFSGACPGQIGQHHVNCQWPAYWQSPFNAEEYACDDFVRWRLWELSAIEPWYRQNMFIAKLDVELAGKEARIQPVIHPQMLATGGKREERGRGEIDAIVGGHKSISWYASLLLKATAVKWRTRLKGVGRK